MATLQDLDDKIATKAGKKIPSRVLANNTRGVRNDDGSIGIVLHQTEVLRFLPGGEIRLDTGGWATSTTKDRLNTFLPNPLHIVSVKGQWYVQDGYDADAPKVLFYDGIVVRPGSQDIAVDLNEREVRRAEKIAEGNLKMNHAIDGFLAKNLTPENLARVMTDTGGDCWACKGFLPTDDMRDHLFDHLREGYFMGSMVLNAIAHKGYRNPGFIYDSILRSAQRGDLSDSKRLLRVYLRHHLLQGAVNGLKPVSA